ncbi:ABC transporter permease, partial [Acidobacteriota bacterium]
MFKNYIKIAFRNIIKHKAYSLINILGFALGISCFLLIMFYVIDEFSYDTFHSQADRIYRVAEKYTQSGKVQLIANSSSPWGPAMAEDFPEVLNSVRLMPPVTQYVVSNPEKNLHFYERRFVFSDPTIFDVFDFELIEGDLQSVLSKPGQLVLTESTARKYFDRENPIGKTLMLDKIHSFSVTGIVKDVPNNSHLKFDFLASFITLQNRNMRPYAPGLDFWLDRRGTIYTYILMQEGASPQDLEQKIPEFMQKHAGELYKRLQTLNTLDPFLQPIKDIHLRSHIEREWEPNSYIQHVYIFGAVAVFILLIACFNFMNLSTARASLRAQEVGLRKVVGAERSQLIRQFLSESVFFTALATILAVGMTHLFLPLLNRLTIKTISISYLSDWWLIPGILFLILIVGLLSGSYPAFLISSFQPVRVLKGQLIGTLSGKTIRKVLTVFQFAISIGLIIALSVVSAQMSFIRSKDLGYDKKNIVVLPLSNTREGQNYRPYKEAILNHPKVEAVSASHTLMGKP